MRLQPLGNLPEPGPPPSCIPSDPRLTAGAFGLIGLTALLMAGMGWLWTGPGGVLVATLAEALRHIESLHGNPLWRMLRGLRHETGSPTALRTHPRTRDRIARLLRRTTP